jgi:hypothetical protein
MALRTDYTQAGAMKLSIMTFRKTAISTPKLSITTHSIMTLSTNPFIVTTISKKDAQHKNTRHDLMTWRNDT